jgi:predicted P-loop ATPase
MAKKNEIYGRVKHEGNKLESIQEIENFIYARYNVRYNTIKHVAEFQSLDNAELGYKLLSDRDTNSMIRRMKIDEKIKVSTRDFYMILDSDFAETFDPIKTYFESLPEPDENKVPTYMDELASHITLKDKKNNELWLTMFKAFLVRCVANALTPIGCQNDTCLVLTGGQGAGKSYFINNLCPPFLKDYIYANAIDLKSKDTLIMLGQNFIINIDDQLDNLYKQDAETMKQLISSVDNFIRLPHGKRPQHIPRIANFLASVNHTEFLRDQSGNRRMLPFEVKSIDFNYTKIDINKVWAEAYHLYKSGTFKYKYSSAELNQLFDNFSDFFVITPEEELLLSYFELRNEHEDQAGTFLKLTPSEIEAKLSMNSGNRRLSSRTIGQILTKKNCMRATRSPGIKCYWIRELDIEEREREQGKAQPYNPPAPHPKPTPAPVQQEIFQTI